MKSGPGFFPSGYDSHQDETKQEATEEQKQLASWISAYQADFISHAVWKDNVHDVLTAGKVAPAEYVLREEGVVSFEQGSDYGGRGRVEITSTLKECEANKTTLN